MDYSKDVRVEDEVVDNPPTKVVSHTYASSPFSPLQQKVCVCSRCEHIVVQRLHPQGPNMRLCIDQPQCCDDPTILNISIVSKVLVILKVFVILVVSVDVPIVPIVHVHAAKFVHTDLSKVKVFDRSTLANMGRLFFFYPIQYKIKVTSSTGLRFSRSLR